MKTDVTNISRAKKVKDLRELAHGIEKIRTQATTLDCHFLAYLLGMASLEIEMLCKSKQK